MADSYGPKGFPKYGPDSNAELWPKLQEVAEFSALVGNRRVGTAAERSLLSASTTAKDQAWLGLEFHERDTGLTFRCTGTAPIAWVNVSEPNVNSSFPLVGAVPGSVRMQMRGFHADVVTGASGTAEVVWPGGAFPNAVLSAVVGLADADSFRGWNANLRNKSVQTLDRIRFIVTDASGASVASGISVPVTALAFGY